VYKIGKSPTPEDTIEIFPSINKTDTTEKLLKVALNTITLTFYRGGQFIGGANRSIRRKPLTCSKSPTNFIR
jgi:hypothetical protein